MCGTNPIWAFEFEVKTVTDISSLPGTASFFMLCAEKTHLYLTVLDMPPEVMEVRSMRDTAPSLAGCPLRQVCYGNAIVSAVSDTLIATLHVPRNAVIILCYIQFWGLWCSVCS